MCSARRSVCRRAHRRAHPQPPLVPARTPNERQPTRPPRAHSLPRAVQCKHKLKITRLVSPPSAARSILARSATPKLTTARLCLVLRPATPSRRVDQLVAQGSIYQGRCSHEAGKETASARELVVGTGSVSNAGTVPREHARLLSQSQRRVPRSIVIHTVAFISSATSDSNIDLITDRQPTGVPLPGPAKAKG